MYNTIKTWMEGCKTKPSDNWFCTSFAKLINYLFSQLLYLTIWLPFVSSLEGWSVAAAETSNIPRKRHNMKGFMFIFFFERSVYVKNWMEIIHFWTCIYSSDHWIRQRRETKKVYHNIGSLNCFVMESTIFLLDKLVINIQHMGWNERGRVYEIWKQRLWNCDKWQMTHGEYSFHVYL